MRPGLRSVFVVSWRFGSDHVRLPGVESSVASPPSRDRMNGANPVRRELSGKLQKRAGSGDTNPLPPTVTAGRRGATRVAANAVDRRL